MCWVHHIEPETKDNRYSRSSLTYPLRSRLLSRDVDGISFLGSNGIMFIDYLKKGRTVKGEYYANLLFKANAKAIEAKRSGRTN